MLTAEQMAHFKARLEAERAVLVARRDEKGDRLAEMSDDLEDESTMGSEGDQATDMMLEATDQTTRDDAERDIAAIDHALQRIADGTYGTSEESGQPIPIERLEALPFATRTVEEQARYDAQYDPRGGGDRQY